MLDLFVYPINVLNFPIFIFLVHILRQIEANYEKKKKKKKTCDEIL